jgi:hypothetical protein
MVLPAVDSVWFPEKDLAAVPDPIILPGFFGSTTYHRGEVRYQEESASPPVLSDYSLALATGGSVAGVDFSLLYFDGWQSEPLVTYELFFVTDYDIIIRPEYRMARSLGLNAASSFGPIRLWTDAAFTFNKSFASTRIAEPPPVETELERHNALEATAGVSFEAVDLNSIAVLEYSRLFVFGANEDTVVLPYLHQALAGTVLTYLFDYRVTPSVTTIVSLPIGEAASAVVYAEISYAPSPQLELVVRSPFFLGASDSELGQYADNHTLSMSVNLRF